MTALPVFFRPEALGDIQTIYYYILDITKDASFAEAYVNRLRSKIGTLSEFPQIGRRRDALLTGMRQMRFERAYTIFYRVTETQVEVTRVLGSRQNHAVILARRSGP